MMVLNNALLSSIRFCNNEEEKIMAMMAKSYTHETGGKRKRIDQKYTHLVVRFKKDLIIFT
jgi:hypothetical protein